MTTQSLFLIIAGIGTAGQLWLIREAAMRHISHLIFYRMTRNGFELALSILAGLQAGCGLFLLVWSLFALANLFSRLP